MKKLFDASAYSPYMHIWLLGLRLGVAAIMIFQHGLPKWNKLMAGGEVQFADPIGLGAYTSFILVIFAELFCSIFLALGLATRLAVIPLIFTMFVVVFLNSPDEPFAKKELPTLYTLIYGTILVLGSGKYALDALIEKRLARQTVS